MVLAFALRVESALPSFASPAAGQRAIFTATLLHSPQPDPPPKPTLTPANKHLLLLIAAADGEGGGYQAHMKNLKWEFAVIDSQQANAFVAPGGKVVVYTGEA